MASWAMFRCSWLLLYLLLGSGTWTPKVGGIVVEELPTSKVCGTVA